MLASALFALLAALTLRRLHRSLTRHSLWQDFAWKEKLRYRRGWFHFEIQGSLRGIEIHIVRRALLLEVALRVARVFIRSGRRPLTTGASRERAAIGVSIAVSL